MKITDGGRTYAQQVDVKRRKPNLAAKPGTSNHEIGTAVDVASDWVRKLGNKELAKYGLYKSALSKGETWHVDLVENNGRSNKDTIAYLGGVGGGYGGGKSSAGVSASSAGRGTGSAYKQVPSNIMGIVNSAAQTYKVNPYLIAAIIKKESTFKYNAGSNKGAKGYMQLMPNTAKELGVKNPWDAKQNINGGTKYIAQMLDKYDNNIPLALAAYNWGAGNLNKAIRKAGGSKNWAAISRYAPKETRDYVSKIMSWR
ncbi:transglycosylase SLT domain-containing protein [Priestia aryabhattai]|uniref:transglycosylase SLT domain-containing protein n=1 Tax=Priestia aryabhattai TaxID=412384 RepID=UPI0039A0406C